MPEYLTLADIRSYSAEVSAGERATIVRRASRRSPSNATFLSHSTLDAELLPGVIRLLELHGAQVYVDKKDGDLPPYTSRSTATLLKKRIMQSRKFILFATNASKDSRWIPWELGISDGLKRAANTAVLPGVDTIRDVAWAEREYLRIYDRIVYGDLEGGNGKMWMVWNQRRNDAIPLVDWLGD